MVSETQDELAEVIQTVTPQEIDPVAFFDYVSRKNTHTPELASLSASVSASLQSVHAAGRNAAVAEESGVKFPLASWGLSDELRSVYNSGIDDYRRSQWGEM